MTEKPDTVRILLVDDQHARLLSYEAILRELGHDLVTATSGVEALDRLMREEFAVILLDVSMPGMDGFETASLIHEHPRFEKTPIIFVTGLYVTDLDRLKGYELGAVDYVFVPVVPEILRSKVSVLAELYVKRKELQQANRNLERANAELAAANSTLQSEKNRELERANAVLERTNSTLQAEILERQRLEEALLEADRRKDEFLAMLAHELRNPLAPILNAVQLMRLRQLDDADVILSRDMIERQTEHLSRLVEDLVDMSRITQGKIKLQKETLALSTVMTRAIETTQPIIDARRHVLTVDLPPQPVHVLGDMTRLAQVVGNLLNNAAKYTEDGGAIRLSLVTEPRGDGSQDAVIRVRDTGVGIPAEMLPHVFDLFTQVERTLDRAQGGLGIGLALVRRLVDLHGGSVSAHSDAGAAGSEFVVRLPTVAAPAAAGAPVDLTRPASGDGKCRVLIADDNLDSAESLAMLLRQLGHTVATAKDGLQAVAMAEQFRPDIAVLDIGMPKLDGCGAAQRIRQSERGRSVFLIAVTGWGREDVRGRTRQSGFDAHLVKPVEFATLVALMAGNPRAPAAMDVG